MSHTFHHPLGSTMRTVPEADQHTTRPAYWLMHTLAAIPQMWLLNTCDVNI